MPRKDPEARRAYEQSRRAQSAAWRREKRKDPAFKARDDAANRRYIATHTEQKKAYNAVYGALHREALNEKERQRRKNNKTAINAAQRQAYAQHPERSVVYRQKHWPRILETTRVYRKANPDKTANNLARYRARKRHAPINDLTLEQWQEIKEHYGHCCVYCGRQMQRLSMDHIIPLSKGGSHTASNIVPACQRCNASKNAGPPPVPVQPLLLTIARPKKKKAS